MSTTHQSKQSTLTQSTLTSTNAEQSIQQLKHLQLQSKRAGGFSILGLVFVFVLSITFFLFSNQLFVSTDADQLAEQELLDKIDEIDDTKLAERLTENFTLLSQSRAEKISEQNPITNILSTSITRLGAVMLAIFMMQILLSFFRYYTRLANYYGTYIVALTSVADRDENQFNDIISRINPEAINFGKDPQISYDRMFEIMKNK
ncbi:hypothetical protein [Marinicellulosiphila megalodicopiae]|uniref:hypothetical protein n=1 Tax=Marinicellulosiphila megalodicopiae TaxID=2724896 RepID=UPI003BAFD8A8